MLSKTAWLKVVLCLSFVMASSCKKQNESDSEDQALKATRWTLQGPKTVYLFSYSPVTDIRPVGEDLCWYYVEVPQMGAKTSLEKALTGAVSINKRSVYTKKLYNKYTQEILMGVANMAVSTKVGAATCAATATGVGAVVASVSCVISGVTLVTSGISVNNNSSAQIITDKADIRKKTLNANVGGIDAIREAVQKSEWNNNNQDKCLPASEVIRQAKKQGQVFSGEG